MRKLQFRHTTILGLLIALTSVIYFRWLNFQLFSFSDWWYKSAGVLREGLSLSAWVANHHFGSMDIVLNRAPMYLGFGLFGLLGFDLSVAEKFLVFWPAVILGPVSGYLLVWEVSKSRLAGVVGAFVFAFNTYFLAINTQGHILLTLAANFAVLGIWLYLRYLRDTKSYNFILSVLAFLLGSVADFRMIYIALGVLFIIEIFELIERKVTIVRAASRLSLFVGLVVTLNLYWLLPTLISGGATNNEALGRALFGDNFWNTRDSLLLFHPFWTGSAPKWFIPQNPQPYFFLVPLFAFLGAILGMRNRKIIPWLAITLLGIVLAKQVDQPFSWLYPWLYAHLPGFNAFREATKFYFLISMGYAVLIGVFAVRMKEILAVKKFGTYKAATLILVVLGTFLINTIPIVNGSISTLFTPRAIPEPMKQANSFLDQQPGNFRTLWLPSVSRWANQTNSHPTVNAVEALQGAWRPFTDETFRGNDEFTKEMIVQFLNSPSAPRLMAAANIKYIVVPNDDSANGSNTFQSFGGSREYFADSIRNLRYLKPVALANKEIDIYEVAAVAKQARTESYAPIKFQDSKLDLEIAEAIDALRSKSLNLIATSGQQKTIEVYNPNRVHAKEDSYFLKGTDRQFNFSVAQSKLLYSVESVISPELNRPPAQMSLAGKSYLVSGENILELGDRTQGQIADTSEEIGIFTSISTTPQTEGFRLEPTNDFDQKCEGVSPAQAFPGTVTGSQASLNTTTSAGCMYSTNMDVRALQNYILSFEYKTDGNKTLNYVLTFNDAQKTSIRGELISGIQDYRIGRKVITPPIGSTKASLKIIGFAPPGVQALAVTSARNLTLETGNLIPIAEPILNEPVQKLDGARAKRIFEQASKENSLNLVSNSSFESGSWQQNVGDCDANGRPGKVRMKIVSGDAVSGTNSIELGAKNHVACVATGKIKVLPGGTYSLGINYRSDVSAEGGYSVVFDDANQTSISRRFSVPKGGWKEKTNRITAPLGAQSAVVYLYAFSNSDGLNESTVRYDDVNFSQVGPAIDRLISLQTSESAGSHLGTGSTEYNFVSPSSREIKINGIKSSSYLAMAEAYHPRWALRVGNADSLGRMPLPWTRAGQIASTDHFNLNNFENGWYIDVDKLCRQQNLCTKNADGSFDINLVAEFTPQRWFHLGLIISGATLAVCLLLLGGTFIRRRPRHGNRVHEPAPELPPAPVRAPPPSVPRRPLPSPRKRRMDL